MVKPIKWDLKKVRNYCKERGFEFLSSNYTTTKHKYKFKCACGNTFIRAWGTVYYRESYDCGCIADINKKKKDKEKLKIYKRYVKQFGAELLADEYRGTNAKYKFICKCGNTFIRTIDKFKMGSTSCGCEHGMTYWDLNKVKDKCRSIGLKFLSEDYINPHTEYLFECSCGNTFTRRWAYINEKSSCGCKQNRVHWDLNTVQEHCNSTGIKFLSNNYKRAGDKYKFKCVCGNVFYTSWTNFRLRKSHCGCQAKSVSWDLHKVRKKCEENGIKFLSKKYNNNKQSYLFRCFCGRTFERAWDTYLSGYRHCGCLNDYSDLPGYYNLDNAYKNKKEWKSIKALLYKVKLYNSKEKFYKIGITTRNISSRMAEIPYKYKVLKTYKTNLYDAIILEGTIIKHLTNKSYTPREKFNGHTECFT